MYIHDATEIAYKNGYIDGQRDMACKNENIEAKYKQLQEDYEILCKMYAKVNEDLCIKTKERDAAIADIEKYCRYCIVCKNADFTNDYTHNRCRKCCDEDNRYFEWRGAQEDEHEAD